MLTDNYEKRNTHLVLRISAEKLKLIHDMQSQKYNRWVTSYKLEHILTPSTILAMYSASSQLYTGLRKALSDVTVTYFYSNITV